MSSTVQSVVPDDALLRTFGGGARPSAWGSYADCFTLTVDRPVSLEDFVFAFYTSRVFRFERFLLRLFIGTPSTDEDALGVARGTSLRFAAWYVGERTHDQLLMCDRFEQTRSWFRVLPMQKDRTLLQFGSAVAATRDPGGGTAMSRKFRLLLGFHLIYSKILLRAAQRRLTEQRGGATRA